MRNPLSAAGRTALAALFVLAAATCTDQPTEPGGIHAAKIRFTPVFTANAAVTGLPIDNVTVTVVRPAAETLVVRNAPFALTDSVLNLSIPVTLDAPSESLQVTVALQSGASILFQGTDTLLVDAGDPAGPAPAVLMKYVGPGANIASLTVAPGDTVLSFGDTLFFGASAIDSSDANVPTFYLHWSVTPTGTPITPDGRVIAPNVRKTIKVHATTPSGAADSISLTFIPVPTQVVKIAGDLQSDTAGQMLPQVFVVEVRGADNLPIIGVPVTFAGATAGDSTITIEGVTDLNGQATAYGVLGSTVGTYSFTATVAGVTPAVFQATANAGPAAAIAKVSGDAQSDTSGHALPLPLVVRVADAGDNPVAGAMVIWTRTFGSGTPALDTVLTDGAGHAQLTYTLGAPGTDSVRAQLAGTAAFVDFTATAAIGAVKVVAVSGDLQTDTVTHLLTDSLVIQTQDVGGNTPIPGIATTWVINVGTGHLSADTVVTDSLGFAVVKLTFDTTAGPVEVLVDAHLGGALGVFHLTAVAEAPHHLAFLVAPPDTTPAGALLAPQPVIQVQDTFNNPILHAGFVVRAFTESMFGAPKPKGVKASGIQFTGFTGGIDSALTDTAGTATFTGVTITGNAGGETYDFQVDSLPITALLKPFTIIAGAPSTVLPNDGTGQSAKTDSLLPIAPQVEVIDGSGNPVFGATVAFVVTAGGGSVTGDTVVTDSSGLARVGSWRMGPTPGADTLEARVTGASTAVFTATALPPTPIITLSLLNTNVVGVGRSATLKVALSSPDTVGVVVTLTDLNPGVVTLDSATATFTAVDTAQFRVLTGVAAGTADIIATAPGYIPDTLTVTGSLNLITLPTTQNVALGQTASLPVQLALPAGPGGVVVNVSSLDPTKVSVVTPTVTFLAGEQLKNATVSGVALGNAAVVADNPNYAPDTSLVSTTASLNITATTLTAFSGIGAAFTTEFRSAGALTPAPAGGILVTLTPADPTCVAAPATTTIPAGQTSKVDSLNYGGGATLPCVTYLVATSPGIDPDSVQVTINPPPALSLSFVTTPIGSGMQDGAYGVNLATGAHGGRVLTVKTITDTVALVQPDATTPGTDSITMFIPNGTTSASFYIGALEGITSDSALIVTTMPGFKPDTGKVYVRQGAFDLQGVPGSTNVLSNNTNIYLQMGIPNVGVTAMQVYQGARAGGSMPRVATFHLDSNTIATFKDSSAVEDTVKTVTFPIGQYYSPLSGVTGLQIDPVGVGLATVTASVPGLQPLPLATRTMTVTPAAVTFGNVSADVGAGLQDGVFGVSLSGPSHPDTLISLKVDTSGIGYVQTNATTVGVDSMGILIPSGQTSGNFYLAGAEGVVNDSVGVIASVPGFIPDTIKLRVRKPGVDLQGVPTNPNSLAANTNIYLQLGIPNLAQTAMQVYQGPRFGGTMDRLASFNVSPGDVAILHDSTATPDSTKTTLFPVGQYYTPLSGLAGIQFDPLTPGVAVVVGSLPLAVSLPLATRSSTITGPVMSFSNASADVGSGLQDGAFNLNLGATAHGGVHVILKVLDTTIAFVQPNGTTAGTDSLQIFVPNGTGNTTFYLAGHEGIFNDSTRMIASVAEGGFGLDTIWIRVRRPMMDLQGVPAATTTLSPNTSIYVQLGVPNVARTAMAAYEGTRFGQPAETVTVRSLNKNVASIVNSSVSDSMLQVAWPVGQYYTPLSIGSGGLGVDPLTTGTDTITVSHPVFTLLPLATRQMVVSTPAITLSGATVGSGLQRSQGFTLGAPAPVGDTVIVKSTVPGILKISPNATTLGTDSIIIVLSGGQSSGGYYVQGVEDSVGTPSVIVQANGYTQGSAGFNVVAPAIDLQGVPTSVSAGAANSVIYGQIGVPNGPLTAMAEYQEPRAGGTGPVIVTFSNSDSTAAQLTTTTLTAQIVTALISSTYYSPLSVAGGGAAFDPLAVGSTVVTVSAPGFIQLPLATRTVNLTP